MKDLVNDDQDRFFVGRLIGDVAQLVRVFRQRGAVFAKFERRVGVDEHDLIGVGFAVRRRVKPFNAFDHRAAAEGFQEFALERFARVLVNLFRHVGQVNLNSGSCG